MIHSTRKYDVHEVKSKEANPPTERASINRQEGSVNSAQPANLT